MSSLAEYRATRRSRTRLRTHQQPDPVRRPRPGPVGLGDLRERVEPAAARATDGPKLQQRHRICLPRTLAALDWPDGTALRVTVTDTVAMIATDGPGRPVTVNAGGRLYLPAGVVRAVGAQVGDTLTAWVPTHDDTIMLVGPGSMAQVHDLLGLPAHVRRLVGALDVDHDAAAALATLADRLDGSQLAALAAVSVERLAELGLLDRDDPRREVR